MTDLLDDLEVAVTEVLTRHGRLAQKDHLFRAMAERITEPVGTAEFCTAVCRIFNAMPVQS